MIPVIANLLIGLSILALVLLAGRSLWRDRKREAVPAAAAVRAAPGTATIAPIRPDGLNDMISPLFSPNTPRGDAAEGVPRGVLTDWCAGPAPSGQAFSEAQPGAGASSAGSASRSHPCSTPPLMQSHPMHQEKEREGTALFAAGNRATLEEKIKRDREVFTPRRNYMC